MLADMKVKEQIHKLKMEMNNVAPSCGINEDCENCGS